MFRRLIFTRDDSVIAILRLVLGVIFIVHGSQKMIGTFGGPGFNESITMFEMMGIHRILGLLAICAEFIGGIALIVGFLGRIAALGIMTNMVVAIAMVHRQFGFFMNWTGMQGGEGFEYHLLVLAIGAAVLVRGSGAFSADLTLTRATAPVVVEHERPRMAA
jgi:putative oxidoreductase